MDLVAAVLGLAILLGAGDALVRGAVAIIAFVCRVRAISSPWDLKGKSFMSKGFCQPYLGTAPTSLT